MSAFGNPWGDIDKTKEGVPYVVSDDGWGWLGLAILALVPVVFMGFALQGMANFISSHPIWIIVGYILLTFGIILIVPIVLMPQFFIGLLILIVACLAFRQRNF